MRFRHFRHLLPLSPLRARMTRAHVTPITSRSGGSGGDPKSSDTQGALAGPFLKASVTGNAKPAIALVIGFFVWFASIRRVGILDER